MNSKRVYKNFLHAIEKLISAFAEMYNTIFNVIASTTNYKTQLFIVIKIFCHNIRLKKTRKKKALIFNSAFVADENKKSNKFRNNKFKSSKNISFRDDIKSIFTCICD